MLVFGLLKTFLFLQCCEWCATIKVPNYWDDYGSTGQFNANSDFQNSELTNPIHKNNDFDVESFEHINQNYNSEPIASVKPIPLEYFEYPAKKPHFAVQVAAFHGVKSPQNYYKAYPIKPQTGLRKPVFGKHYIKEQDKLSFIPSKYYTNNKELYKVTPVSSNYEVYHPYQEEEPALKQLYKDPVLLKIRNDIHDNKKRLQNYETDTGKSDVSKDDYLKNPDEIDEDKFPIQNDPVKYELYKPQRRPIYYKPTQRFNRNQYLNRKFKHPLYQNYIKVRPESYRPLQKHLDKLRNAHVQKYDDEHNEYPQIRPAEDIEEISDGIDIYEKGKEKYLQLRNNADDAINEAVLQNRPSNYKKLELQKSDALEHDTSNEDEEFVPVKSYAQVRKTETSKYFPREAALQEATNYEEIENAPRLREAVKSTKSQTVYSEEGYEDTAYDHAGEQKHASDLEGHAGYLKENEKSKGKFKAPFVSGSYNDGFGSKYGDEIAHGEKWQNKDEETQNESDNESSHDDEYDESIEEEIYKSVPIPDENKREKRSDVKMANLTNSNKHNVQFKNFKIPQLNLNNTYLTGKEIIKISKQKKSMPKKFNMTKYPYYKSLIELNKDSPLRYAENLKLIPKKTRGGTEFYDSRSSFQCAEVDEELDPIPKIVRDAEKDNNRDNATSNEKRKKRETDKDINKEKPRLKNLGDKIDCFKAKYFGENPLDSPFFREEIISSPEPIYFPNIDSYNLEKTDHLTAQSSINNNAYIIAEKLREKNKKDIFDLIEKLKNNSFGMQNIYEMPLPGLNKSKENKNKLNNNFNSDVIQTIKNNNEIHASEGNINDTIQFKTTVNNNFTTDNPMNKLFKENETIKLISRSKRSTSFVYEPYKVIRDNPGFDSKKTTTLSNISPLIKQLQSSKLVELIPNSNDFKKNYKLQPRKRNVSHKQYKNITRTDRNPKIKEPTTTIKDLNNDKRKGEPRYEITYHNHKNTYTPVENKKSVTMDDYESIKPQKSNQLKESQKTHRPENSDETIVEVKTPRPFFDVSQYLPKNTELHRPSQPRNIPKRLLITSTSTEEPYVENDSDIEEYDYEDEIDTTTESNRKDIIGSTTYTKQHEIYDTTTGRPKLKLVTKFRKSLDDDVNLDENRTSNPQFTEKSKKSSKSTLVTDSQKYGEGDDDMKKEEIDEMIGIQQDMEEYMPDYEKKEVGKVLKEDYRDDEPISSEEADSNEETDYEDIDDEEEGEDDEDDDLNSDEVEDPEYSQKNNKMKLKNSNEEVELKSENKLKPIILKKKIEIHKEDPVNESLPHITQFKQDIIEEEVIKKLPKKNVEALELYKDESLAKKVNNLADVEIFKEDLRIADSPKHGGNYRRLNIEVNNNMKKVDINDNVNKNEDTVISQSQNNKVTKDLTNKRFKQTPEVRQSQINTRGRMRHTNVVRPPSQMNEEQSQIHNHNKPAFIPRVRGQQQRSAKIKLDNNQSTINNGHMHNGKVKINNIKTKNNIEPKAEIDETIIPPNVMHGGNLKSLSEADRDPRLKAADLLNSFAQAVPILTTTPAYILDPSKRMYYYVDV